MLTENRKRDKRGHFLADECFSNVEAELSRRTTTNRGGVRIRRCWFPQGDLQNGRGRRYDRVITQPKSWMNMLSPFWSGRIHGTGHQERIRQVASSRSLPPNFYQGSFPSRVCYAVHLSIDSGSCSQGVMPNWVPIVCRDFSYLPERYLDLVFLQFRSSDEQSFRRRFKLNHCYSKGSRETRSTSIWFSRWRRSFSLILELYAFCPVKVSQTSP